MNTKNVIYICILLMVLCTNTYANSRTAIEPVDSSLDVAMLPVQRLPHNLIVRAYIGSHSYLANALVIVYSANGRKISMGRTNRLGALALRIQGKATASAPYQIKTFGGTINGKPFQGHMTAYVPTLGFGKIAYLDIITSAAVHLSRRDPRGWQHNQDRVRASLGFEKSRAPDVLRLPSNSKWTSQLKLQIIKAGGFDSYVRKLAQESKVGHRVIFDTTGASTIATSESTPTTGPSNAPCNATTSSAEDGSPFDYNSIINYSTLAAAGMLQLYSGDYPGALQSGLAGFILGTQSGQTDNTEQFLIDIENKLTCISNQINQLQQSIDSVKLEISTESMQNCIGSVNNAWSSWLNIVAIAADTQDPKQKLDANNGDLTEMFRQNGTVNSMMLNCVSVINGGLFDENGGNTAAWYQNVRNTQNQNPNGLPPSSVLLLQSFLAYYGTVEYLQAILTSEYYNYQKQFNGVNLDSTARNFMLGSAATPCSPFKPPAAVQSAATDFCDWQWNISLVWPANALNDEIAVCQHCSDSIPTMSGILASAVPAGLGYSANTQPSLIKDLNPRSMAAPCNGDLMCVSNLPNSYASNTLTSFNSFANSGNNLNPRGLIPSIETWNNPLSLKTAVASLSDVPGGIAVQWSDFFNSWLNVTCTDNTCTPGSNTPSWQILSSSSTVRSVFGCQLNAPSNGLGIISVTDAFYSPGWKNPNSQNTEIDILCWPGSTIPENPSAAYLLTRPWVVGTSWPPAPTVITPSFPVASIGIPYSAKVTASGCGVPPMSVCIWAGTAIDDSAANSSPLPPGLTLDTSSGEISGTPTAVGTYSFQMTALGTYLFSAPTTMTITVASAPSL